MRKLPLPTDEESRPYVAADVYGKCISRVKKAKLREQLRDAMPIVASHSTTYDEKAAIGRLYEIAPLAVIGTVAANEMVKVYTSRMVPKTMPGRPIYNRILQIPELGLCPYCGVGTVNTLDHYLPKTRFPVFVVTPSNLVPACSWCQTNKDEYFPITAADQLIHPYFDEVDGEVWLVATVVEGDPAAFQFAVTPPDGWTEATVERLKTHVTKLKLGYVFASNAGSRLSEIRGRLNALYEVGGAAAVRAHLTEECVSIEAVQRNSWQCAMYRAARDSDWFCSGGFGGGVSV